jgi:hypothetical protein
MKMNMYVAARMFDMLLSGSRIAGIKALEGNHNETQL